MPAHDDRASRVVALDPVDRHAWRASNRSELLAVSFDMRLLPIAGALLAACAHPHDVVAVYATPQPDTGAVDVILNDASRAMSVTINDILVVDRKFSRKAHIDGIPAGTARVHVATGGRCEQGSVADQELSVPAGGVATFALPGPEPNLGCTVISGLANVALEIGCVALAILAGGTAATHMSRVK